MGLAFDVVEKYYIFEQIAVMWPKNRNVYGQITLPLEL